MSCPPMLSMHVVPHAAHTCLTRCQHLRHHMASMAWPGVQVRKGELKDCMAEQPEECEQYRYALFHCRRGQLDARTRIQGNKVGGRADSVCLWLPTTKRGCGGIQPGGGLRGRAGGYRV